MNRRAFIISAVVGTAAISSTGLAWQLIEPNNEPLTIATSLDKLELLLQNEVTTTGQWSLYQILVHCAQSVEYSMIGYPEHKSPVFKNTVGKFAFSAFSAKRRMAHGLNEAIPGAPEISGAADLPSAFERFKQSLLTFQNYKGKLAPHFAYGELTKMQYEQAHVMHFNNHLNEIIIA
ncbi:DUF1569 domain-containing protein [Thalassotalea sp. M1531]|uniref:DUF1569 domain-containing protein n=1 Tax=Thalassotalea algicola TaxID=2716224 RepID=A0A7Y0LCW6_9GAMM|nr:DUF1569 domain-containing protein [Thalassotalea algicola]NMP31987.1 DUF1569 domain-containing protein [Thalassotalea algicola]